MGEVVKWKTANVTPIRNKENYNGLAQDLAMYENFPFSFNEKSFMG